MAELWVSGSEETSFNFSDLPNKLLYILLIIIHFIGEILLSIIASELRFVQVRKLKIEGALLTLVSRNYIFKIQCKGI